MTLVLNVNTAWTFDLTSKYEVCVNFKVGTDTHTQTDMSCWWTLLYVQNAPILDFCIKHELRVNFWLIYTARNFYRVILVLKRLIYIFLFYYLRYKSNTNMTQCDKHTFYLCMVLLVLAFQPFALTLWTLGCKSDCEPFPTLINGFMLKPLK